MLQSSILFLRDPVSQSLKLTGPGGWILLTCILQSSHGSSSVQMLAITAHTDMKCRYAGLIRAEKI